MKKFFIFAALVSIVILGVIFFINNGNNNTSKSPSGSRLSTNVNKEMEENRNSNIVENQNEIAQNATKETEISSFSTEILDNTPGRLTNISITCSTLNNTIVHAGETFSFNQVVGKPTSERGYQKAKIIVDHEAEMGIGGRKLPGK